jgi:hypothetical protein
VNPPSGMASLRDRLLALRDDLRQRLAEADHLDTGLLQILAATEIVLTALDRDGAAIGLPNA